MSVCVVLRLGLRLEDPTLKLIGSTLMITIGTLIATIGYDADGESLNFILGEGGEFCLGFAWVGLDWIGPGSVAHPKLFGLIGSESLSLAFFFFFFGRDHHHDPGRKL